MTNPGDRQVDYDGMQKQQAMVEAVVRAQSEFIRQKTRTEAFHILLADMLALTESEYGFIGDVLFSDAGSPYLKAFAITDISWNEESKAFFDSNAPAGLEFHNLETLFGAALKTGEPVIANAPKYDPRSGGLPAGHPPLNAFLGIPIIRNEKLVAMVGVANKKEGYKNSDLEFLKPLLNAVGQMVEESRTHQEQEKLRNELFLLSQVASQTTNAVIISDMNGNVTWTNDGFYRLTGYRNEEIVGRKPGTLLQGPETDPVTVAKMHSALERRQGFEVDVLNYTKDAKPYWVRIHCNPLQAAEGLFKGFIAIESNITYEKNIERDLAEKALFQRAVLDAVAEGIVTSDQDGIIQSCNSAAASMFGYSETWLTGQNLSVLMPDEFAAVHNNYMRQYKALQDPYEIMGKARNLLGLRSNGALFPVEISVQQAKHNNQVLYVASVRDMSELKAQQQEIEKLAFYDAVTGLPNRRLLEINMKSGETANEVPRACNALLFLDLDDFKNVNDALGHRSGDRLLQEIGRRITECVSPVGNTVARLGGDEFCVWLGTLSSSEVDAMGQAEYIAERIIQAVEHPVTIDGERVTVSASVGVSLDCSGTVNVGARMKQADTAMYEAKSAGKNRYRLFNDQMERKLLRRLQLRADLADAIDCQALTVHYQPIVDQSSRMIKMEALVRWRHPKEGWIGPDVFIPIAETSHLIMPLGDLVLRTVIGDMNRWLEANSDFEWQTSINISQLQLAYPNFFERVSEALAETGLDASKLVFEVTESSVAEDVQTNIRRMKALSALGITFSLDDFGTGYSSLSYLKSLPIHELKIDRSFVRNIPENPDDNAIIQSILSLAKAMDLSVVAEGIETLEQWQYLADLGCKYFQGYYFAKPMPASDIERLITKNTLLPF